MSVREDLIAAKALIDTPEKWIATSVLGAVYAVAAKNPSATSDMVMALRRVDGPRATHADVMALFDRAIEAAKP